MPDERLEAVAKTVKSSELVPATIDFHDIAGLVKGASEGEGLGNQFLASIRETDAICHVVRCHQDANVIHPDGRVDPLADIETIETELILSDYEQVERRIPRVGKQVKTGDAAAAAELKWLEAVKVALAEGKPARSVPLPEAAPDAARNLSALTTKPILYVANVDEGDAEVPEGVAAHANSVNAGSVAVSARIENELAELDPEEAAEMRESYGVEGSGLARLVRAAYDLLELITFFTAGEGKEAVARPLHRGATALEAAGTIHTEIMEAFIKAEAIGWAELVEYGGYVAAREKGALRIEGRDYLIQDGDVVTIRVYGRAGVAGWSPSPHESAGGSLEGHPDPRSRSRGAKTCLYAPERLRGREPAVWRVSSRLSGTKAPQRRPGRTEFFSRSTASLDTFSLPSSGSKPSTHARRSRRFAAGFWSYGNQNPSRHRRMPRRPRGPAPDEWSGRRPRPLRPKP